MFKIFQMVSLSLGMMFMSYGLAKAEDISCKTNEMCNNAAQGSVCITELISSYQSTIASQCSRTDHQCKCGCFQDKDCGIWRGQKKIGSGPRCMPSVLLDTAHCGCSVDADCNNPGRNDYYCKRSPGAGFLTCQPHKK